jgi:hypothetical protein
VHATHPPHTHARTHRLACRYHAPVHATTAKSYQTSAVTSSASIRSCDPHARTHTHTHTRTHARTHTHTHTHARTHVYTRSGKSFLFRYIRSEFEKKYGGAVAVTAPTGVAAINVGGVTIHSWAGVGFGRGDAATLTAKVSSLHNHTTHCRPRVQDRVLFTTRCELATEPRCLACMCVLMRAPTATSYSGAATKIHHHCHHLHTSS